MFWWGDACLGITRLGDAPGTQIQKPADLNHAVLQSCPGGPACRTLNDFHKFTFARMPDLLRILGPLMAQHGVVVMQSEVDHELIAEGVLRVAFDFHILHTPSSERHTIRSSGLATVAGERGGFNDCAIQAVATTARKYVLIALFGVVVDDLPDNDHHHAAPDARRNVTTPKRETLPAFSDGGRSGVMVAALPTGDLRRYTFWAATRQLYTTSTAYQTMLASSGRDFVPAGRRGPLYWPTIARSPFLKVIVVRLSCTSMPS